MIIDETDPNDREQETAIEVDPNETEVDTDTSDDEEDDEQVTDTNDAEDDDAEAGDDEPSEDDAGEDEEEDSNEASMIDIELDGETFRIPEKLKDKFMMQSDYTRKTQTVAEEKKALEARALEVEQAYNTSQEELTARATLIGINQRLEEYNKVDWNAWQDDDPIAAQKGYIEYQQLRDKAGQVGGYLQNAEQDRTEKMQQNTAKRLQETRLFAEKEIKGWTPEVDAKIIGFAKADLGFSEDELVRAINPQIYKTMHLAWIGSQTLAKSQTAKPAPKITTLKPTAKVSAKGGAPARKSLSDMSMEEYADHMNAQEAKRSKR